MPAAILFALLGALAISVSAQSPDSRAGAPQTGAELSGYRATTTVSGAVEFLDRLSEVPGIRTFGVETFGRSCQGRRLRVVKFPSATVAPLRVLVIANIHGGEVDGKEAVLEIIRELALHGHGGIADACELHFVPVFNVDGNEEISTGNRANQNGPDGGAGRRTNARDLDLNRDFVKLDTPEVRALVGLIRRIDPHLFMDLHTTNGSFHGYHLTYAPGLAVNQDLGLARFSKEVLLPEVRRLAEERRGIRTFDYGNFTAGPGRTWTTFSADARLGWNYAGLRNRLGILSESYSYIDFEARIRASKAFVIECIEALVRHGPLVERLCRDADDALLAGAGMLRTGAVEAPAVEAEVLEGTAQGLELGNGLGKRWIAGGDFTRVRMPVIVDYVAARSEPLPAGWILVAPPPEALAALLMHGVLCHQAEDAFETVAESFAIEGMQRSPARFQGRRLVKIRGQWSRASGTIPAGSVLVAARQPLGRLAGHLLDPGSDDGLITWGFFDADLEREPPEGEVRRAPVLRIPAGSPFPGGRLLREAPGGAVPPPGLRLLDGRTTGAPVVEIRVLDPGVRVADRAYEAGAAWRDRRCEYVFGGRSFQDPGEAAAAVAGLDPPPAGVVIRQGKGVVLSDADLLAGALRALPANPQVWLDPYEE